MTQLDLHMYMDIHIHAEFGCGGVKLYSCQIRSMHGLACGLTQPGHTPSSTALPPEPGPITDFSMCDLV